MTLPSLFVSHGSPMLPLTDAPARQFLIDLGRSLPRPKAILVISAHWETAEPEVNAVAVNDTIYDFYGFPRALYELRYPAPGAPELAQDIAARLKSAGFAASIDRSRGLDHGAWVPLLLMYPEADIPVLQLSIQTERGPQHHLALGRALAPLSEQGVLIIGSGSFTHNLAEFRIRRPELNAPALPWVDAFADWVHKAAIAGRIADLLDYRQLAPYARNNHPTEEHFLPLFAALGAAGEGARVERLHNSANYGVLRMDVYAFHAANETAAAA
ncbi:MULTISPECIES: class III extradiol ring-cleavage dioxygenase [unclassified Bradyrhizobium]|uniref:DODA-type extradiol aromatic ring-opening family dioxygenase n=1 Tax=unclassified Bradyrhizobium TaxID=2631580 RepID=UPI002916E161|nr:MULTISPECIES: class III extradiol ring-cleavage dioxygenase [unclassified Bradyrhizobium]